MRITIFNKLFLSLFLTSTLMVLAMMYLIDQSFRTGLQSYINQDERERAEVIASGVGEIFQQTGGWQRIIESPYLWTDLLLENNEFAPLPHTAELPGRSPAASGFSSSGPPRGGSPPGGSPPGGSPPGGSPPGSAPGSAPGGFPFGGPLPPGAIPRGSLPVDRNATDSPIGLSQNLPEGRVSPLKPDIEQNTPLPPGNGPIPLGIRIRLVDSVHQGVVGSPVHFDNVDIEQVQELPVVVDGKTVGWIYLTLVSHTEGELLDAFYNEQLYRIHWLAVAAALISIVVSVLLVKHILYPLQKLNTGTRALMKGEYHYRVDVRGNDELADFAVVVNQLAATLEKQEQLRAQWLADISHELRTPIAVLRSEIEALQDGIRPLELKRIDSLHQQVLNFNHLVNDLYQLSTSETGMLIEPNQPVELLSLVNETIDLFSKRFADKQIDIELHHAGLSHCLIDGDEPALNQLLTNLMENSYRYTDAGGTVNVSVDGGQKECCLVIEDSAPGVPDEALDRLFERLYRVDKSRSRASGGSGLGMAICQNIVKAHSGSMVAQHSDLGGLRIKIIFPLRVE